MEEFDDGHDEEEAAGVREPEEAAEILSVSTKTVRRRISDGTIPAYHCGRRPIRIRLEDLEGAL